MIIEWDNSKNQFFPAESIYFYLFFMVEQRQCHSVSKKTAKVSGEQPKAEKWWTTTKDKSSYYKSKVWTKAVHNNYENSINQFYQISIQIKSAPKHRVFNRSGTWDTNLSRP